MARPIIRWDTTTVLQNEAFSYWQDAVVSAYLPLETKSLSSAGFCGAIEFGEGVKLTISTIRSHASEVRRTHVGISEASDDRFFVGLMLSGRSSISQGGTSESLEGGDMMLIDTNRPFVLEFPDGVDIVCVTIEGEYLRRALRHYRNPAIAINKPTPLKALTASYVGALADNLASIDQLDELAYEQLTALLLRCIIPPDPARKASANRAELLLQVKKVIEREIANPGLGAKRICSALGLSRSALFEAFAAENLTLANFIRRKRLLKSKELLLSENSAIDRIAHEVGFRDHSTFSRAFRRDFGTTPTSFRSHSESERTAEDSGARPKAADLE